MSQIIYNSAVNLSAKRDAFPYQVQAFEAIKDLPYSAIFHEQGLGKTKIAVDLLLYWLENRDIDTILIVTKKQLVKNWVDELKFHTHIRPVVISSNKRDNYHVLNSTARLIIANFEAITTDFKRIKFFVQNRDVAIIIDESTKLKNPEAKLTKVFFEIAPYFKIRTIMTGTPVANRPYDIWAQVYFLDGGASLGTDFASFKTTTDLGNNFGEESEARETFETSVASIFDKIRHFSVRETKRSCAIELPNKTYETIIVTPEPVQLSMYEQVMRELIIEVQKEGKTYLDDSSVALKRLLRLTQLASNPRLLDEGYSIESGKERALDDLLRDIMSKQDKCIVWSNFIENVDYFTKKYKNWGARKIHGKMCIEDRNRSVSKFKEEEQCKILFATPQAAKEGLTLTVANRVIFYDRGFNLDDYLQAQDRIHRISQTKPCFVYNLIMRSSVDEWIDKLLEAKQYAAFLTQGDLDIEEYRKIANYSYGEIIKDILQANNY